MTKTIYIIISLVVLMVVGYSLYMTYNKKTIVDNFNIATDPVVLNSPYKLLDNVEKCPDREEVVNNTQYGGLNPKSNANLTVVDFINRYYNGRVSPGAASPISKQYCTLVAVANSEYLTDRWNSTGECELAAKAEVEELFPDLPKTPYFLTP